jgi:hypothetical protein
MCGIGVNIEHTDIEITSIDGLLYDCRFFLFFSWLEKNIWLVVK